MRHLFTTLCLVLFLLLIKTEASGQPTHGITFRENWYNYLTPQPDIDNWSDVFENVDGRGVELAYQRRLAGSTWLLVPVKLGLTQVAGREGNPTRERLLGNLDLLLQQSCVLLDPVRQTRVGRPEDAGGEQGVFGHSVLRRGASSRASSLGTAIGLERKSSAPAASRRARVVA